MPVISITAVVLTVGNPNLAAIHTEIVKDVDPRVYSDSYCPMGHRYVYDRKLTPGLLPKFACLLTTLQHPCHSE